MAIRWYKVQGRARHDSVSILVWEYVVHANTRSSAVRSARAKANRDGHSDYVVIDIEPAKAPEEEVRG